MLYQNRASSSLFIARPYVLRLRLQSIVMLINFNDRTPYIAAILCINFILDIH